MAENDRSQSAALVRWMRVVGFGVFVLAFLLPAVRDKAGVGAVLSSPTAYKGWFCAFVTLMNTFSRDVWTSPGGFLAILSGWINPLIVIYLILLIRKNYVWPRRTVALAVIAFMAATWIYFAVAAMVPLIGHVLWIAGALMILSGEIVRTGAPAKEPDAARTQTV